MAKGKASSKRNAPGKGRKKVSKQKQYDDDEAPKKVVKRRSLVQYKDTIDDYEPSESDDELGRADKILLESRRGTKQHDESEEEVLGVHSSSSEEEDDDDKYYGGGVDSDMDSDIEGQEKDDDDVDTSAWGSNKKMYYDTDYVDKDFGGMSKEEEELALMEEEEALNIQKRLFAHMEETDFTLGMLDYAEEKKAEMKEKKKSYAEEEKIETDISGMSKEEKLQLLKQNSPIVFKLIEDFQNKMELAQTTLKPLLNLVKEGKFPKCVATDFVEIYYGLVLNYCTNISFYFVHRSSEMGNAESPVVKRLLCYRKVLDEMDITLENQLIAPLTAAVKQAESDDLEVVQEGPEEIRGNRAQRRKRKLQIIEDEKRRVKLAHEKKAKLSAPPGEEPPLPAESESEEEEIEEDNEEEPMLEEVKREITYEMRKNKGLTPRRKKENRNPRVKHKNKYRKALIRRKGQVREARTEVKRYGGEVSGIKAYTTKSIKFKN